MRQFGRVREAPWGSPVLRRRRLIGSTTPADDLPASKQTGTAAATQLVALRP